MHVGSGTGDLAQSGRLERVLRRCKAEHRSAAAVLARQTDVVECIIGKGKAAVAFHAPRLAGKEPESGDLILSQRVLVARDPAVKTRIRRHEGPLIGRDRLGEI